MDPTNEVDTVTLTDVTEVLISTLVDLHNEFFDPAAKITIMVRLPGEDDADIVVSNDDLKEVAAMVDRSIERERKIRGEDQTT